MLEMPIYLLLNLEFRLLVADIINKVDLSGFEKGMEGGCELKNWE